MCSGRFVGTMLIIMSVLALLAFCLARLRKHPVDKLPGPPALPFVGNVFALLGSPSVFDKYNGFAREYWPLYRTWHFTTPVVHLLLPEHVEKVLASGKNTRKSRDYRFVESCLFSPRNGPRWDTRREILTPSFESCFEGLQTISEHAAVLTEKLELLADQQPAIDIVPLISLCALDIICGAKNYRQVALGRKIHAMQQDSQHIEIVNCVQRIMGLIVYRSMRPWLHPECIFHVSPTGIEFRRCLRTLHGFMREIIAEKRLERAQKLTEIKIVPNSMEKLEEKTTTDGMSAKNGRSFLDLLLELSEGENGDLSDQDICEQVDSFMFRGRDTTSSSISWALFYLGCNSDIQEDVFKEINLISSSTSFDDISSLTLLDRVVKETLRLRPPVPLISRFLDEPLELDEIEYPKGTAVNIHIYNVHRNPDIFKEPNKFDPDRFLPENSESRHPYAYIPFSGGPRNCLGRKFALLQIKVVLATLIRRFRFEFSGPDRALHARFGFAIYASMNRFRPN
ncbi:cytochrome P450 4C1-like isoform X2 [Neocloeon triangulifer]|uniref:cytochrome P450 4C1-like isoform X2 n=1 Tax=Neocloeon triangulifer TaxID=2078957 RepID=UPI00286EE9C9|nr:cytochrome P450 4C1-like isoform X2 [Neocloeon triangulifer]